MTNDYNNKTFYPYELVTFELFDFLENERKFKKEFSRIAYETNIIYKSDLMIIKFKFEMGWASTFVTIKRKKIFWTKEKKVELLNSSDVSEFGNNWLHQNPQSTTTRILNDKFDTTDYCTIERLKTETKNLLYLREHLDDIK